MIGDENSPLHAKTYFAETCNTEVVALCFSAKLKDSPEPPEAVPVPSRLEGHVTVGKLSGECFGMIAEW